MKKRFLAVIAAVSAAAGLTACGGGGGPSGCKPPAGLLSDAVGKFADEFWACESEEVPTVSLSFYFVKDGTGDSDAMGNLTWAGEDDGTGACGPDYTVTAKDKSYGTFPMNNVDLSDDGQTLTFVMSKAFTIGPESYPQLQMTCVRTAAAP